ncbi:MAG: serine/threonine kinase [Bacteroidota bacterium]|nr:serine/threonine kinase [Bacteroidota bacterium]
MKPFTHIYMPVLIAFIAISGNTFAGIIGTQRPQGRQVDSTRRNPIFTSNDYPVHYLTGEEKRKEGVGRVRATSSRHFTVAANLADSFSKKVYAYLDSFVLNKNLRQYLARSKNNDKIFFVELLGERAIRFTDLNDSTILHMHWAGPRLLFYGLSGRLWTYSPNSPIDTIHEFSNLQKIDRICSDTTGKHLLVIGGFDSSQLIYRSANGGRDWKLIPVVYKQTRLYSSDTALVIIFSSLAMLIAFIATLVFRRRKLLKDYDALNLAPAESELAVMTDNPTGAKDIDVLGFSDTEDAIIKLMKNPDTKPPMTIVLSGSWGSGKSSMLRGIREKLDPERFNTVWFNVWHLQGETTLLATFVVTLMRSISGGYGFWFRIRLFLNRLFQLSLFSQFRFWLAWGLLLPLFVMGLLKLLQPYLLLDSALDFSKIPVIKHYAGFYGFMATEAFKWSDPDLSKFLTAILVGGAGVLGVFLLHQDLLPKIVSSFVELIPFNELKMDSVKQDPGFRDRFKREFWEVIKAADPNKKIVVFIDDVDRVTGDRVLELLETINLISDTASKPDDFSGVGSNLFFVIGMASDEVAKNLGAQLRKLNESSEEPQGLGASFLEKMVDLTIAVPSVNDIDSKSLIQLSIRNANGHSKKSDNKPQLNGAS